MGDSVISGVDGAAQAGAHRPELAKRGRLRRQMYLAQLCSYLIDTALLFLYYLAGTTAFSTAAGYLAAGALWTGIVLALSEAHFNDRFRDHYLTVPQSMSSISIQLGAIYLAPEVGFYFACIIFIVLAFGALRMSAQQTGIVWAYAALGLTIMFALTDRPIAMPMDSLAERQLALLCFVTALGRCAFTGLYGTSLREALYKRSNELKAAQARIEALAQVDELTGLNNRRSIMGMLNDEMARAQRSGAHCSVAIIDLDLFKRINDGLGHPVGDEVLRRFAHALTENLRAIDKIGRYGGEEFLLILPDCTKDQALLALDRLRRTVADLDWTSISDSLRVTMSAGVTQVGAYETTEEILSRADKALYRAKDAGRNRVLMA
jgi:diguanylate cyclase (GGDEF)-like protein